VLNLRVPLPEFSYSLISFGTTDLYLPSGSDVTATWQVTDGADGLQMWSVAANILKAVENCWQRVVIQLGVWARG